MKPSFITTLTLLAFAAILPAHAEAVLGKIGEIEIGTSEIREALAGLEAGKDSALSNDPAAVNQYVRALLIQRLVLKQAEDKKFDQDPAVIAKLVRARETALAEAYIDSFTQPPADFPSESELAAAYESAKPSLLLPRTFRLAQIFIAKGDKAETRINDIAKQLKAKGADFATIARASSEEAASAANGGEIGWLAESQIQPGIRERLPKLSAGAVSEPIQLNGGWHLIKVLETKESTTATLEQIRPQLIARLRSDRAKQLRADFITKLVKENPVAINEIELSKILPKSGN